MKKNPPQNPTLKTVIVSGDDKGGVGKTSNAIHLTDGLRALGYQVELVDADSANRTLSEAEPQAVQL
jgi:cellulose biosynthesis protein BcsQ